MPKTVTVPVCPKCKHRHQDKLNGPELKVCVTIVKIPGGMHYCNCAGSS